MPRFSPYRRASRVWLRVTLFLVAPLLWVLSLLIVAVVVRRTDAILIGALIAAVSFVVAVVLLVVVRRLRIPEERDASRLG
jgi:uncharacterized membrane protein